MQIVIRALVGLLGLAGVLIALRIWMAPEEVAAQLGVGVNGPLGIATIRADMAGFFGGAGAISLFAAIRNRGRLLVAPFLLVAIALAGRALTVMLNGYNEAMLPPMVIEAVLVAVFGLGIMKLTR
jgi:hypothetical protein